MKLRLDGDARIQYALQQGRQEGWQEGRQEGRQEGLQEERREGELLGRIALLQELLSESAPTREELAGYDLPQLIALCEELQQRLRHRS